MDSASAASRPGGGFPFDGGRMGEAVRTFDWSATRLGALSDWPEWLRASVGLMLSSAQPMALWIGPELLTLFNDGFAPLLGKRADTALGRPIREVWFDVWDEIEPLVEEALAGGTVWRENFPLRMTRNGFEEETYWTFSYSPVRDPQGRVVGFLDVVTESTESVVARRGLAAANASLAGEVEKVRRALEAAQEAERLRRILQRELSHRMKNTLAMVQVMVTQSLRHAVSIEDAAHLTTERIQALGRAQDTLTATNWAAADVEAVVRDAIKALAGFEERFLLSGPAADLDAERSMGLSLAIHELATNAVKYGALSTDAGRVEIAWSVEGERFGFEWHERGGPPVEPPSRKGFGSRLTERVVPSYFKGSARLETNSGGVVYRLEGKL